MWNFLLLSAHPFQKRNTHRTKKKKHIENSSNYPNILWIFNEGEFGYFSMKFSFIFFFLFNIKLPRPPPHHLHLHSHPLLIIYTQRKRTVHLSIEAIRGRVEYGKYYWMVGMRDENGNGEHRTEKKKKETYYK